MFSKHFIEHPVLGTELAAGPLVRSSYRAERVLAGNNVGLRLQPLKADA